MGTKDLRPSRMCSLYSLSSFQPNNLRNIKELHIIRMGTNDLGLSSAATQVTQLDVFDRLFYSIKSFTLKGGKKCSYVCKHFPQSPRYMGFFSVFQSKSLLHESPSLNAGACSSEPPEALGEVYHTLSLYHYARNPTRSNVYKSIILFSSSTFAIK